MPNSAGRSPLQLPSTRPNLTHPRPCNGFIQSPRIYARAYICWRVSLHTVATPSTCLRLHSSARCHVCCCVLSCCLQLVEVSGANSRSTGVSRATVEGSHDLRPGSDGFRPLDATVVEVRATAQHSTA